MVRQFRKEHIFTVELPYEKDAAITNYFREHYERVDNFIMSLGQMSKIPPSTMDTYILGKKNQRQIYGQNVLNSGGLKLYLWLLPTAIIRVSLDIVRALKSIGNNCDIFFAQHFLPAYVAIILRKLKILKCSRIIFWMFDFFLIPPDILRGTYFRGVDLAQKYIRRNVDEIWYTTPRLRESDKIRFGPLPNKIKVRITEGCFFKRIPKGVPKTPPPIRLAFLGSLRLNNAVYESIECVKYCLEKGMQIELHIIGSGPEEERMKRYVAKHNLKKAVIFYGFEDRGNNIAQIFSKCHFGLALYAADAYGPNWYLTSGKFRRFISQRLPIITTSVPYFVKYIHRYHAGLIVDNDPDDIYQALLPIYDNPSMLRSFQEGVDMLFDKYQTNIVFNKAIK